jgi:hypothetical protein
MEFISNVLGIGTPKATPNKQGDQASDDSSSAKTTSRVSKASSVVHSVASISRRLANAAETAVRLAEESLAREEAGTRGTGNPRERYDWDNISSPHQIARAETRAAAEQTRR